MLVGAGSAALTAIVAAGFIARERQWARLDVTWVLLHAGVVAIVGGALVPELSVPLGLLAAAAAIDARFDIIPNSLSFGMWVAAGAVCVAQDAPIPAAFGGAFFAFLVALYAAGGIGAGDVKLLPPALAVALLSAPELVSMMWRTQLFVAVLCAGMLVAHAAGRAFRVRGAAQPMGPAIFFATAIAGHGFFGI